MLMKTEINRLIIQLRSFKAIVIIAACATSPSVTTGAAEGYVAHEWGTFTSVQGGGGALLDWRPLVTSELPGFIHNWSNTGIGHGGPYSLSKTYLVTLQRMETPVIYFYSSQPMNVDVNVGFPKGFITEWYPMVDQIGPAFTNPNGSTNGVLRESRAIWRNLEIVPTTANDKSFDDSLPKDNSGSHYFAARKTASNLVRAHSNNPTNSTPETDKFIFYRGAGSFATPLRVTVDSNDTVIVENTGSQNLTHLFLVNIQNGFGAFAVLDALPASNSVTWVQLTNGPAEHWTQYPLPQFQDEIGAQMQAALTSEGLFTDEAKAMVETWKDSWFSEQGTRIFYILPRPWVDEILPITFTPAPKELTRVMVGRAEIITPETEAHFSQTLVSAQSGDPKARLQAAIEFKNLGRFAEPALQLTLSHATQTNLANFAYQLLYPTPSPFE